MEFALAVVSFVSWFAVMAFVVASEKDEVSSSKKYLDLPYSVYF